MKLLLLPFLTLLVIGLEFQFMEHRLKSLQLSFEKLVEQYSSLSEQPSSNHTEEEQYYNDCHCPMEPQFFPIKDCTDAKISGSYRKVWDQLPTPSIVYCEMESYGGGWLVIQQRIDGSVDFDRTWEEYKRGFGTVGNSTEFWIGLEIIHQLTSMRNHELMIELRNDTGHYGYARFSQFSIAGEDEMYRLSSVGQFSGTIRDSLEYHKDQKFSTRDRDHDESSYKCSDYYTGGWWYKKCAQSAPNGAFIKRISSGRGIYWSEFAQAATYSRMMIRAK